MICLRQLKLVIWKNLIIRKRHWFLSILEIAVPLLLFIILAYTRSKIGGLSKIEKDAEINDALGFVNFGQSYTKILYMPQNNFTDGLMQKIKEKEQISSSSVLGFKTEETLTNYFNENYNHTIMAVIFNMESKNKLDYTIRYHEEGRYIDTNLLYQPFSIFGLYSTYLETGLLKLQHMIDLAYIETVSQKNIPYEVLLKPFPYPPRFEDSGVKSIFGELLPHVTYFSFLFIIPAVLKRVVEEKQSGIKELQKMVGLKSWMLWLGWFIHGMIPIFTSTIVIVVLMKVPFWDTPYPPIEYTDGTVLYVFLILYCMSTITYCFLISTLVSIPALSMIIGLIIWIVTFFAPLQNPNPVGFGKFLAVLVMMFPNVALKEGYSVMSYFEEREVGVQWNNLCSPAQGGDNDLKMIGVLMKFIMQIFIFMTGTYIIDSLNPGPYGISKSFKQLLGINHFKRLIRRMGKENKTNGEGEIQRLENTNNNPGIELINVTKKFGHFTAVDNLSFGIYKNQITMLLGHNGAGKSTTMSMITGMLNSTSGTIVIDGKDVKMNSDEVRMSLGLCPQHNLLFSDLTVTEHLLFFAMLKGKTYQEGLKEAKQLLKTLNMNEKAHVMANTLSGGMKRKLCLGMAIIGDSKVLILDEPTSGMDPESRRELWDLLLEWKGSRTILISTHFLEEADELGDWIAIMGHGKLLCYGTPYELKKKYDTGYHLSLIVDCKEKTEKHDVSMKIKNLINSAGMEIKKPKSIHGNNIVFTLPLESKKHFSKAFDTLERKGKECKITNMSVTITTLEDVFLSSKAACDKRENSYTSKSPDVKTREPGTLSILMALIAKRLCFFKIKWKYYIAPIAIAALIFCFTAYLSKSNSGNSFSNLGPKLPLNLSSVYGKTGVVYGGGKSPEINSILDAYKNVIISEDGEPILSQSSVDEEIIEKAKENIAYYKTHMMAGAEFKSDKKSTVIAYAFYSNIGLHSAPISVNMISNALAKVFLGPNYSISTSFWPLSLTKSDVTTSELNQMDFAAVWLVFIPLGLLFLVGCFILFPHAELSTNYVYLQYMSGLRVDVYWLSNFGFDTVLYILSASFICLLMFTMNFVFHLPLSIFPLYCIVLMFGVSGIPFSYIFSRRPSVSGAFAMIVLIGMFLGIILTIVIKILKDFDVKNYAALAKNLDVIFLVFCPPYGLSKNILYYSTKAVKNYNWNVMSDSKKLGYCSHEKDPCCFPEMVEECKQFQNYFTDPSSTLCNDWALMIVGSIFYLILNIVLDSYYFKASWEYVRELRYYPQMYLKQNEDMVDSNLSPAVVVSNDPSDKNKFKTLGLRKRYCGKYVVNNVTFDVKDGECLGLLGVNGAGKTTTFNMLTKQIKIDNDKAEVTLGGKADYLKKIGYCPQFDSLNFDLTGRELLTFMAQLRGVEGNIYKTVTDYINIFDLKEYADQPCGEYSGGNKRKLSLAMAMMGIPELVLLDEPTNGVDPASRRDFWNILKTIQEERKISYILTSHSMLECEALCNRLGIMKNGRIDEMDELYKLKQKINGFTIVLKLKSSRPQTGVSIPQSGGIPQSADVDEVDGSSHFAPGNASLDDMKDKFKAVFEKDGGKCELKEEHRDSLHYYIGGDNKRLSVLFNEIENIRSEYSNLIEDYALSETSLEDVFLKVAREK